MGLVVDEVKIWNSPVIGSFLLWKFTSSYIGNHPFGDAPVGLLHFLAIAILTDARLINPISNHRPNLQSYVRHFEEAKSTDLLLSIHDRVEQKKEQTLAAIDQGCSQGLLVWNSKTGQIISKNLDRKPTRGKAVKNSMNKYGNKASILGKWFSEHEVSVVAANLKVVL